FMDLIQELFENDLFLIYPEPLFSKFLKNVIMLLNNIKLKNLYKFIEEILPEFNISLLIDGNKAKIVIHLQKSNLKSKKSDLRLKFSTPNELGIKTNDLNQVEVLTEIRNKLKTEKTYYFNQNDIITLISDFFELLIPLKKESLKLIIQKTLFGYRSYEMHWNVVPRPKIYNTLIRFLIRLLGFNINLRKLSHWAIPDVIFNYFDFYFGLNSRLLLIITDLKSNKNLKTSGERISKNACKQTILLEIEESTLKNIRKITKNELFSSNYTSLISINSNITKKYGKLSTIIVVDQFLLENIIRNYIFNISKVSFFPRFKTLRLLRDQRYFKIFPEFPFYKLIKKKNSFSLLRLLLPIIIDKHEF
ncbi:MAG: hypothetical protein ACFFC3_17120, partial [Candidatus Odinarchaeota archaeon]